MGVTSVVGKSKTNYSVLFITWGNSEDTVHRQLKNTGNPKPILYPEKNKVTYLLHIYRMIQKDGTQFRTSVFPELYMVRERST